MSEHVILVAFTVEAPDRAAAETRLAYYLPRPAQTDGYIESWWVAEDDRRDGSDNDSAVFCHRGVQAIAYQELLDTGLTSTHNDPSQR